MYYADVLNKTISFFCSGKRTSTFHKDFSYVKDMTYENFLKDTFKYYLYNCHVNNFYFYPKTSTDLDLVDTLRSVRMRGCGNSKIICIADNELRDKFSERDKARYDGILDGCDVKIDIRNSEYIQDLEIKTTKRLIDICDYCLLINCENDSKIRSYFDYAKSKNKAAHCYE